MKRVIAFIMFVLMGLACCACQPTPDVPPVVSKNDGTLEKEIYEGAPQGWELSVPETYSCDEKLYDAHITVKAQDVNVECSKTVGFPVYEATFHMFTADEIQDVTAKCFPDGGEIYIHDRTLTKDEVMRIYVTPSQETLWKMENGEYELFNQQIVDDDGVPFDMERYKKDVIAAQKKRIEEYKKMAEQAPEKVERKSVDFSTYTPGSNINIDVFRPDGRVGRVRVKNSGRVLQVSLGDYQLEDSTDPRNPDAAVDLYTAGFTWGLAEYPETKPAYDRLTANAENAHNAAVEFTEMMGWNDTYKPVYDGAGSCPADWHDVFKPILTEYDNGGWDTLYFNATIFTRDVEGVQMSECCGGSDIQGADIIKEQLKYSKPYPLEAVIVFVGENGISGFTYKAPLELKKVQDNVRLKNFDDVSQRIVSQLSYMSMDVTHIEGSETKDELSSAKYADTEIAGIYMRYIQCSVQDDASLVRLIPVWIVTGHTIFGEAGDDNPGSMGWDEVVRPYVVINAIDGSAYNLGLGY